MRINLLDARYPDKPVKVGNKDTIQGEINYKLINKFNRDKEMDIKTFKKYVVNGAVWTPAVLATPIKSDPYNDVNLIVTKEEWDAMGDSKQYRLKEWELDTEIYRRMEICWTRQEIFALDFDSGISITDALKRCKELNINPFWLYNSYSSSKDKPKFRLLFKFETPIEDFRLAKFIQNGLMKMFTECDTQCSDLCRYFFGTNKDKYALYNRFDHPEFSLTFEDFCLGLFNYCKQKDKIHYSRNIEDFAAQNFVLLDKNNCILFDKSPIDISTLNINDVEVVQYAGCYIPFTIKEMDIKYNGYKGITIKSNGKTKTTFVKTNSNYSEYRIDFDKLRKKCKLVDEAYNSNYELGHAEYFKLMQLFSHLYGGDTEFEQILNDNYINNRTKIDVYNPDSLWNEYTYIKYQGYNPPLCDGECNEKRCIYADQCIHAKTPLHLFNIKTTTIEKLNDDESDNDIDKAYDELDKVLEELYNSTTPKHTIVNAPTGIGKTTKVLELLQSGDVLAFPNHDLIQDVYQRLLKLGKNALIARKRPELADDKDESYYQYLNGKNLNKMAQMFWKEKVKKYSVVNPKELDCINWMSEQKNLYECSDKIILCTHHKLPVLFKMNKHIKNVIIDEDPIKNILINSTTIKMKDFEGFINLADWMINELGNNLVNKLKAYKKEIIDLNTLKPNVYQTKTPDIFSQEELKKLNKLFSENENTLATPVLDLFESPMLDDNITDNIFNNKVSADILYKKIIPVYDKSKIDELVIVNRHFLPEEKNIVILSASITPWMANKLNIDYKEIDFKYTTDNIMLYFNDTYSQSSLKRIIKNGNNSTEIAFMKNILENNPVITFKNYKEDLKKLGFNITPNMHFGKCEGFDELKGQDIGVIGTFHLNPIAYEEIAAALDIDLSSKVMKKQAIIRNGYSFKGFFYDNEELREIQCYSIETNTIQAAGRSRTYRTDAKVYLFSNYPIKGVKIMN